MIQRNVDTESDSMEEDMWFPPAMEHRPQKRTRRIQRDPDTESDSMEYLDRYLDESDSEDNQNSRIIEATESLSWQRHEIISAQEIDGLECQAQIQGRLDTEMYEDNSPGCDGVWKICRDPTCYR